MNLATAIQSSIGRKIINGVTGLFFVGFVIGHLTGNLMLIAGPKGPELFNSYAHFLTNIFHGVGLLIIEAVMLAFLTMHAATGISVWMNKQRARTSRYAVSANAGGKSRKSTASQFMIYTGILLLVFLAVHIAQFKYGVLDPRDPVNHSVMIDGVEVRNLYGLVVRSFGQTVWWLFYSVVMVALGLHLWHGTWSAFQSLGLANDRYLPTIRKAANALAVLLTVGFLLLPTAIYLGNDHFMKWDAQWVQSHSAPEQPAAPQH